MIRTQVYLTDEQVRAIKLQSQSQHKPEAVVIRELVDQGLRASRSKTRHATGQVLLDLAALGREYKLSGPSDLSTNLDDYLYGDKQ